MTSTPTQTIVWLLSLCALACVAILLRKGRKAPRNDSLYRRHRRIQQRQLGEAYRDDGYTVPQMLYIIGGFTLTLLFIPACYAIIYTVFGMQEPRW